MTPDERNHVDFSRYRARRLRQRLLALLNELAAATERRDLDGVWRVLDDPDAARYLPDAVRKEVLQIATSPVGAFKAPVRMYLFYHTVSQLGDEPMVGLEDPDRVAAAPPSSAEKTAVDDALSFPDRRSPDSGPRPAGTRRSGSR